MGVLKLARSLGPARLDAACERALEINSYTYQSLHSILKNGLDCQRREAPTDGPAITHPNIRRTKGAPSITGPPPAGRADYFH